MPKLLNGSKGDSNPDSLNCESAILPLSSTNKIKQGNGPFESIEGSKRTPQGLEHRLKISDEGHFIYNMLSSGFAYQSQKIAAIDI